MLRRLLPAAAALVLAMAPLTPGLASDAVPLLSTSPAVHDLASLQAPPGRAPVLTSRPSGPTQLAWGFTLPAGVSQGDPVWFVQHLRATVAVAPGARGHWNLSMDVNGFTSVSLDYRTLGSGVQVDSVSLLGGRQARREPGRTFSEVASNYAQDRAFLAGKRNEVRVKLEPVGRVQGVLTASIEPGSALETTALSPYEVEVGLPRDVVSGTTGRTVEIPYEIRRRGSRAAAPYTVLLGVPEGLSAVGPVEQHHRATDGTVRGTFRVTAEAAGTYQVGIRVKSGYNVPGGLVRLAVRDRSAPYRDPTAAGLGAAGAGAAAAAGATVLLGRRTRRTP